MTDREQRREPGDRAKLTPLAVWWAVAMLALASVVSILDRSAISVMVIDIKASLGLSDAEIGLAQGSAFAVVYCLASLHVGNLADHYPRRLILCVGMILWSLAATATGLVTGFVGLLLVRMLIGLGEATITPCALSLLSQIRRPEQLAGSISIFVAAGTAGTATAFALGGWLLDHFSVHPAAAIEPWRQVMIALGLPGVLVALIMLTIREPARDRGGRSEGAPSIRAFLRFVVANRRPVGALIASHGLTGMMVYSAMGWGVTYGRRVIGMPAAEIGGAMGLIAGGVGIAGALAMGFLVDRLAARGVRDAAIKCYVASVGISVPLGVVGFVADLKVSLLVGLVALQGGVGSLFGVLMATQQIVTPLTMRGRMAALAGIAVNIVGFGIGPLTVGLLTDYVYRSTQAVGLSVATVLALAGMIAPLLLWRARADIRRLAQAA